jgi:adenosylcobyric acid synthase
LVYEADIEETLDRLAAHIERHVDCDRLFELAGFKETP